MSAPAVPMLDAAAAAALGAAARWTLPLLAVWAATRLAGLSAAARHHLWAAAFASLLLLPIAAPLLPAWGPPSALAEIVSRPGAAESRSAPRPVGSDAPGIVGPASDVVRVGDPRLPAPNADTALRSALASIGRAWPAVWAAVSFALLAFWMAGHAAALRLFRLAAAEECAERLSMLEACGRRLGTRRRIRLLVSATHPVPVTWGLVRPAVLLPEASRRWPAERLRGVLLHEAAHVARMDVLTHAAGRVACAVFWFHPGAWLALRALRTEAESACDDRVVAAGVAPCAYAGHLLHLARSFRAGVPAPAGLPMARPSGLERRILSLLDDRRPRGTSRRAAVLLSAAVALAAAASAGFRHASPGAAQGEWLREVALDGGGRGWALECGPGEPALCREGTLRAMSLLQSTGRPGAVVVQRVATGEIVAYAAVEGEGGGAVPLASPASVAKLAVAALWWETGMGDRRHPCPGRLVLPSGRTVRNFSGGRSGTMAVPHDMLVASCNTAAASMAAELRERHGDAALERAIARFGFGARRDGGDGATDAAFWARPARGEAGWTAPPRPVLGGGTAPSGDELVLAGVGVGEMRTTPLHVSRFLQAVGNDGVALAPRPAGVTDFTGDATRLFGAETAARLRAALLDVVGRGTASGVAPRLRGTEWRLGGKTGTALRPDGAMDGWFAGLIHGPGGAAEYTVVAYVEGGGPGGAVPAGIAADLVRFYGGDEAR